MTSKFIGDLMVAYKLHYLQQQNSRYDTNYSQKSIINSCQMLRTNSILICNIQFLFLTELSTFVENQLH